jgi:hypothetical protein
MALLFVDSFDHYSTSEFGRKYDGISGATIETDDPRNGPQHCKMGASSHFLRKQFPNSDTWIIGVAIKLNGEVGGSQDHDLFSIIDHTVSTINGTHLSFQVNFDNKFRVMRGSEISGELLATSDNAFTLDDAWHYVEFQCVIHDSTGSFSAKFDGAEIAGLTQTSQETIFGSGNAFANGIRLNGIVASPATKCFFDDFYIANGDAPGVQAMLGDMKIDALFPRADGNYEELTTSSGTDSFALINELPPTTDDSTYIESNVVNEKSSFSMDEAGNFTIHGVQHTVFVRKTDVNRRKMKHLTRVSGNDYKGDLVRMGSVYTMKTKMWETNPKNGSPWIASEVNGAEFGLEVI